MDSNAGFASRIGRTIDFEDYSTEELVDMFVRLTYKSGMRISDDARAAVTNAVENARNLENFGNARYIRNLYEASIMEHAKNTVGVDDADILVEFSADDIPLL